MFIDYQLVRFIGGEKDVCYGVALQRHCGLFHPNGRNLALDEGGACACPCSDNEDVGNVVVGRDVD